MAAIRSGWKPRQHCDCKCTFFRKSYFFMNERDIDSVAYWSELQVGRILFSTKKCIGCTPESFGDNYKVILKAISWLLI
jgi:hypothetical protein